MTNYMVKSGLGTNSGRIWICFTNPPPGPGRISQKQIRYSPNINTQCDTWELSYNVIGHCDTSFELWTATIGPQTTPEKCFNTPIENALCRCQFEVIWGKNRGYPYWILTPNERVLSYQVPDVCAKFHQYRLKIATVRAWTDRQTHRQRWQGWSYNLSQAML